VMVDLTHYLGFGRLAVYCAKKAPAQIYIGCVSFLFPALLCGPSCKILQLPHPFCSVILIFLDFLDIAISESLAPPTG